MKKLLVIVFLGLTFSNISHSKISKLYYDELYNACMEEAMKANLGFKVTKEYCKCSADHFDDNYNDSELVKLESNEGGAAFNDVINFVVNKCRKKAGLE